MFSQSWDVIKIIGYWTYMVSVLFLFVLCSFFAATLQNNFKQFALKKCSTPPSHPPFFLLTAITVLRCEIFCIWQTLCHSVHCKNLLTVVTAVPSLRRPPPAITAFRAQYYVLYGINMFVSLCLVETECCNPSPSIWKTVESDQSTVMSHLIHISCEICSPMASAVWNYLKELWYLFFFFSSAVFVSSTVGDCDFSHFNKSVVHVLLKGNLKFKNAKGVLLFYCFLLLSFFFFSLLAALGLLGSLFIATLCNY